jgi:SpoVK/Ycf46/Vps4 family AAA+-type ATPase
VIWFYKKKENFKRLGIEPAKGAILYGPPGCGKTLLAKSVSIESGATFIPVQIPELVKSHVGESEKAISSIFRKAIDNSPSVLFLDEIDAIFTSKDSSDLNSKLVSQLISEIDDLTIDSQVVVLAATNYIDAIDSLLLESGKNYKRLIMIS